MDPDARTVDGSGNGNSDRKGREPVPGSVQDLLAGSDASVLDLVDHVLNQGVVIQAELILGVADVDLIYLRLSALLCAVDRILEDGPGPADPARQPELPGMERGTAARRQDDRDTGELRT